MKIKRRKSMSEEAHPNIHAVGLTVDILSSIENRLRNKGKEHKNEITSNEDVKREIVNFVASISCLSDDIVNKKE